MCQCVCQCVSEKNKSINISHVRSLLGCKKKRVADGSVSLPLFLFFFYTAVVVVVVVVVVAVFLSFFLSSGSSGSP